MAINPLLYGVKEVADVLFYPVGGTTPTLFFDSLKISNLEFTAETTYARGGKGNPKLIGWDYNREIMLNLQDALISQEFMALLAGTSVDSTTAKTITGTAKHTVVTGETSAFTVSTVTGVTVTLQYAQKVTADGTATAITGEGTPGSGDIDFSGSYVVGDKIFITYTYSVSTPDTIIFNSNNYPGTYKVIGDTVIRDQDGTDHAYQFIIHKAKLQPGFTITMEAEGDPSVFDLALDVLANDDGDMIELIKY